MYARSETVRLPCGRRGSSPSLLDRLQSSLELERAAGNRRSLLLSQCSKCQSEFSEPGRCFFFFLSYLNDYNTLCPCVFPAVGLAHSQVFLREPQSPHADVIRKPTRNQNTRTDCPSFALSPGLTGIYISANIEI